MDLTDTPVDPPAAAREAGLQYVSDAAPGIARRRSGLGFRYQDAAGRAVRDRATLQRIRSLAIPPAWRDVWICPSPRGHLQATGRDQRGRKQFRYHPRWREVRDEAKYHRTLAFGLALPRIRRRVAQDLRRPGLGREKVLAVMVRLLEATHIRIGNEEYLRQNRSVGLSTMRDRHVQVRGARIHFAFRGKGGKLHDVDLDDPRLARLVRQLQDLPGQELFQYIDEEGRQQSVTSHDVNAYLREIGGEEFSAKDFRTWAGTVFAAVELSGAPAGGPQRVAKGHLTAAIQRVALRLGNTPAICRRCYIHPVIMESYLEGTVVQFEKEITRGPRSDALHGIERTVLRFLHRRLRITVRATRPPAARRAAG